MLFHGKKLSLVLFLLFICPYLPHSITTNTSDNYHQNDHYLIDFGVSKSFTAVDGGQWRSDEDFLQSPPSTTNTSAMSMEANTPYDTARIFRTHTNYSIPASAWGPKLIRVYLYPPSSTTYYNSNLDTTKSFLSLEINGLKMLGNFSGYLASTNAYFKPNTTAGVTQGLVREFYVTINEKDGNSRAINLTFSPSNQGGFGFINGIEVLSIPEGLYVNRSSSIPYLRGGFQDYMNFQYSFPPVLAMENVIRLNVGGKGVAPSDDAEILRTWYADQNYVISYDGIPSFTRFTLGNNGTLVGINYTPSTPSYTAPVLVYSTLRCAGPYAHGPNKNLTWAFEVDSGFDYLVRLHFCNIFEVLHQENQLIFNININNQTAYSALDVVELTGGQHTPMYKDSVTSVYGDVDGGAAANTSSSSRVLLWVTLLADNIIGFDDAFANGLEIFKLSSAGGSLVAPNPALPAGATPSQSNNPTPIY